jgi:hypothetical protein
MKKDEKFTVGSIVFIDGKTKATVKEYFSEGSTSYLFPHCKVDFLNGDKNVSVSTKRVSKTKLKNTKLL